MECGKVQDLWAQAHHISQGHSAGKDLFYHLVNAWTKTRIHDVLHILQDDDLEESYHALYMQSAIRKAGINSLRLKGLQGLTWSANGDILDPNGHPIRWVWKTWAWETALDQIRAELSDEDQEPSEWSANQQRPPRLADVLLHPNVMVYEPLWTLIPSNKAILPVLCQLFPAHPYLLDSQYRLTDSLKNKGYVIKPIAGRCGANISIVDRHDNTMAETSGQFDHQQQIYQELHSLPKISGRNVQTNSFVVDGKYAGTCIRVDESLVINSNSDILALRILADDEYKSKQE